MVESLGAPLASAGCDRLILLLILSCSHIEVEAQVAGIGSSRVAFYRAFKELTALEALSSCKSIAILAPETGGLVALKASVGVNLLTSKASVKISSKVLKLSLEMELFALIADSKLLTLSTVLDGA